MRFANRGCHLAVAVGMGLLPWYAQAAAPPGVAPPVTPGAATESLRQPPQLQPPGGTPQISGPAKAPPGAPAGPTVVVQRFTFSGNSVFTQEQLAPLVAGYLNRPVTLGELYEAADKVAEFYADKGYTLASVALPAQKIKDGTVRFEIIEGRVGSIGFQGNRRYSSKTLQGFVVHTQSGTVYKNGPLEQDLQTLNGLPGLAARAVLKPGSGYGTSDVVIKTQEKMLAGNVVFDNYGRKDIGRYRASATVTLNNPLTIGDQVTVLGTHSTTNGLNYGYVDYNVPLDHTGLRFDANYGYARFRVGPPTPVGGRNDNLEVDLQQPWWRTPSESFATTVGYLNTRANADLNTGQSISNTSINLFELGATYAHAWNGGAVSQGVLSIHSNFTSARITPATNRDVNRERFRGELDLQHLQPLFWRLQLLAHLDGVFSPDPLADTEQMSIGGPTSIRAFESSEARGDRGYYGQLTLRRPFGIGAVTLAPRFFFDGGRVLTVDPLKSPSGATLSDIGAGADLLYRTAQIKVDWSYPLDGRPESDGLNNGRVFAAVSVGF